MNKLVHRLCTSLLFAFSLTFPAIAQTLYPETDTPLPTKEAIDLRLTPRFGVGYSTSGADYDAFSRLVWGAIFSIWADPDRIEETLQAT